MREISDYKKGHIYIIQSCIRHCRPKTPLHMDYEDAPKLMSTDTLAKA